MKAFCFAFVLFLAASVSGQSDTGSLTGTVKDREGNVLPGANVKVEGDALSRPTGTVTAADGTYTISSLSPGRYRMTVSYIGYRSAEKPIEIVSGRTAHVDVILKTSVLWSDQMVVSASRAPEKMLDSPASISVVDGAEMEDVPSVNVVENVRTEAGVDFAKTGLIQNATVIRGYNNVFSGSTLTLMDNRIGRVPSLRVNVNSFIPVTSQDVDRIEIVRGPGSALYGPNAANGVVHIITKSPFESEGTIVGAGGGERSLRTASFRHAATAGDKIGFKVSGQYFAGTDWKYVDPVEVQANGNNPRDYDIEKFTGELRVDVRPDEDTEIIFSGGFSQADQIELTGLGAAQAENWRYQHLQTRVNWKDWFAQVFYNRSDAGDTRLLRTGAPIVDRSTLTVLQLQHSPRLNDRQRFTYGGDILWTRPKTGGTISGSHEDNDDINEYGVYLQSETRLTDRLDLVLAGRYDSHNHLEDDNFSPRAALVYKPDENQTFRTTYNRAFSTPTSNNLFLDLVSTPDAFGVGEAFEPALGYSPAIDVRALGVVNGFTFNRDASGLPTYRSPFAPVAGLDRSTHIELHDPAFTNVQWGIARGAVLDAFIPTVRPLAIGLVTQQLIAAGLSPSDAAAQAPARVDQLIAAFRNDIVPQQLPGLRNSLAALDVETAGFDPVDISPDVVNDIVKLEPTITETYEVGYKGIFNKNLLFTADVYRTETEDFVGPLKIETPNVFLDGQVLGSALTSSFGAALADSNNAEVAAFLTALDGPALGGDGDGTAVDELVRLFVSGTANNGAAFIPFGTVTPTQAVDPTAVTVTYRNFGDVTLYGTDLGLTWFAPNHWIVSANYSYVSKDIFRNVGGIDDIALNSPKHKANIQIRYDNPDNLFSGGVAFRYRDAFPMDSGAYVGTVDAYAALDLNFRYELPLRQAPFTAILSLNGSNILDNEHQEFIGAPAIGRLVRTGVLVKFLVTPILFVLLLVARSAHAEEPYESVGRRFTMLPLAGFSSDDGPGAGFRLNLFDYNGRTVPYQRSISLQGFFTTKGKWAHRAALDYPAVRPGHRIEIVVRYDKEETANYFGELTDTDLEDYSSKEEQFEQIDAYLTLRWIRELEGPWRVQIRFRAGATDITPHTPARSVIETLEPLGTHGGELFQLGSSLRYDTRDNYINSTRGRLDEAGVLWGVGAGGAFNGGEIVLQHRHFFPIAHRLVFGQRYWVTYTVGDVPFYERPKLGSSRTLRGLSADRYRHEARILVNTELRWLGVRVPTRPHTFAGLNVFADVGQAYDRSESPSFGDWEVGLGTGLRIYWYSTIVRADYGRSGGDSAVYMRFSQIF